MTVSKCQLADPLARKETHYQWASSTSFSIVSALFTWCFKKAAEHIAFSVSSFIYILTRSSLITFSTYKLLLILNIPSRYCVKFLALLWISVFIFALFISSYWEIYSRPRWNRVCLKNWWIWGWYIVRVLNYTYLPMLNLTTFNITPFRL